MNGYTDCSQAQRDQAKAVAKTYPTNFPTDLAAIVAAAKSDGYVHAAISGRELVGAVALVKGTTRVRAGVIVKATKTRAYILYYVQSSDRYFISTMDLAWLHIKAQAPTCEKCGKIATQGGLCEDCWATVPSTDPATEEASVTDVTLTDVTLTESGKVKVEAHLMDRGLIPPRKVESLLNPLDAESFRTGNLAEDVEAWLTSKGYGKK